MASMDVFKSDAFSMTSMLAGIDKLGYVPQLLGSVAGLFVPPPLGQPTTEAVWIESRENGPALIQTSPRGAPIASQAGDRREARPFKTGRLAQGSRILASELAFIREMGEEQAVKEAQKEVARRQLLIMNNFELTKENMRLGAVMGKTVDADGSTIYDWESEFSQSVPAEIDFDLDAATPASGVVRKKCNQVTRSIRTNLKGLGGNAVSVMGICGDAFWDDLTAHSEVRQTYLNTQEAAALREGNAWESFRYGGITFTNYRGTDDGSTVAVGTDKCRFFPVGAGIFQEVYAPGEKFADLGTRGQSAYPLVVPDRDRDMWVDVEMYSYPLMVCVQPSALHRAKRT